MTDDNMKNFLYKENQYKKYKKEKQKSNLKYDLH